MGSSAALATPRPERAAAPVRPPPASSTAPSTARPAPPATTTAHLLALQRHAGNGAVTQLVLQRRPALPAPRTPKKPAKVAENSNHYLAFYLGIESLYENWRKPKRIDFSPLTADDLHPRHRELLVRLNAALLTRGTDPQGAFEAWQAIEGKLRREIGNAARFPAFVPDVRRAEIERIDELGETVFTAGAYYSVKDEKRREGHLESPDKVALANKLKNAEATFVDAKKMYEEAAKLGAAFVTDNTGLKKIPGGDVVELILSKGSIEDKLAAARKTMGVGTVTDLVAKIGGVSGNLLKQTSSIGVEYCTKMGARALAKGATAQASNLKTMLAKFEGLGRFAEKVGKGFGVLTALNDWKNFCEAVFAGDFDAAMSAAADLAVDTAPLVFGGALAAPLSASVIVIKAQVEAIHLAAAFIRWCKDETVRVAAQSFVDDCLKLARTANDLVADAEIIVDPTKAAVHHIAEKQLVNEGKRVAAGLAQLAKHVDATEKTAIGGHAAVKQALGKHALDALFLPHEEPLVAAQQVGDVFKGANLMMAYVKKTYTN